MKDGPGLFYFAMKKVLASREGLIGGVTAAGLKIRYSSVFVALPAQKALWKTVRVVVNGHPIVAPVLDLGPWFPFEKYGSDDQYVFGDRPPLAEIMKGRTREGDEKKLVINGAGIDLSDGLIAALGLVPAEWGMLSTSDGSLGLDEVEWEFVN